MENLRVGLLAGFIAIAILSLLMIAEAMMGVRPIIRWIWDFVTGTVAWGGGFALLNRMIPGGSSKVRGTLSRIPAWFIMMTAVMPLAVAGAFTMMVPIITLVLYIILGAVLSALYRAQFWPCH